MGIVMGVLLFSLLVFLHELGHFVTAKLSGIQVNEFSIFMGPAIFKKQVGDTLYAIRCIPFGGYCAMEGEDGESDNPHAFGAAAWWKRAIVLVAGAFMNFIAGVVLLAIVFAPTKEVVSPTVTEIDPQCSFAGEAGIQVGDTILKIGGERIYVSNDVTLIPSVKQADSYDIQVLRDGKKVTLEDLPMTPFAYTTPSGEQGMRYGITLSIKELDFGGRIDYIFKQAAYMVRTVRLSLVMLITGKAGVQDVMGPIGVVGQISQAAAASPSVLDAVMNVLYIGALISINLGVMNLLPIPALDGGRVVSLLISTGYEAVTHKKLNPKYEAYVHGAGMILLLVLMALICFKDIFALFR